MVTCIKQSQQMKNQLNNMFFYSRNNFTERSLAIERKQKEKDLSEGNENFELIYTSYDDFLREDYDDILDPGLGNEVADYLYKRYCISAKKVHEEYFCYQELCKHDLGYYYLKNGDNDSFNRKIQEKLSRKGGKYWDLLYEVWDNKQTVIFHLFYDRIKLFTSAIQFYIDEKAHEKNEIPEEELKQFNFFLNLCKKKYDGFTRELFRLFCYYGLGNDFLNGERNRVVLFASGDLHVSWSISIINHFQVSNIKEFVDCAFLMDKFMHLKT